MKELKVIISNEPYSVKVPKGLRMLVRRCCNAVVHMENLSGAAEIFVTFTDNAGLETLNEQYLQSDEVAGVLTLPSGANGDYSRDRLTNAKILGNVIISLEKAALRSELFGRSLQKEVGYLTAHGVLGLFGYRYAQDLDKMKMREKETQIMEEIGLPIASSYLERKTIEVNA